MLRSLQNDGELYGVDLEWAGRQPAVLPEDGVHAHDKGENVWQRQVDAGARPSATAAANQAGASSAYARVPLQEPHATVGGTRGQPGVADERVGTALH